MKKYKNILVEYFKIILTVGLIFQTFILAAQNPLSPAQSYTVFSQTTTSVTGGSVQGSIANSSTSGVNMTTAFATLQSTSYDMASMPQNITPNFNWTTATISLTLPNAVNVWNVSFSTLQQFGTISFSTQPSSSNILFINVNCSFTPLTWAIPTMTGIGQTTGAPYVIWNFYNVSGLTISNGGTLEGSLLAPNTAVSKTGSNNVDGQIICKSYTQSAGQIRNAAFLGSATIAARSPVTLPSNGLITDPSTSCEGASNANRIFFYYYNGAFKYFEKVNLRFSYSSGVINCNGTIREIGFPNRILNLNITASGETTNPPLGSPHENFCSFPSAASFRYYPTVTGTVTGSGDFAGLQLNLARTSSNAPTQIGNGANADGGTTTELGMSSWLQATTTALPSAGAFYFGSVNTVTPVDLLARILPCNTATISGNNTICRGTSTTLTASGGNTYLWSNGATTTSITVSPTVTTTYSVTSSETNGCTSTASSIVTVGSPITVTATSNTPVCVGNTLNLSSTVTGNSINLVTNGNFNTAAVTGFNTDVPNGSYGFTTNPINVYGGWPSFGDKTTGTGNMMWLSDDNTATNRRQWYQSYSVTSGQTYTMRVWVRSVLSGNPTLYWSVNGTQVGTSITPTLANGWVQFTQTWTASSTGTATFAIVLAQNSWDYDFVLDDVEILATNPVTYSWSGPNSFTSTAQNPTISNVTAAASGTYTVTATSSGCTATASTAVTISSIPTAPTGTSASRCGTGTVTLGASGCSGGTINWYSAASGGTSLGTGTSYTTPSIAATTIYYTECTLNGCVSTRTAITATVNSIPTAAITGTNTICPGSNTTLTASGGGTYLWSTGATTTTITVSPTSTTTYTVTVTSSGCTATASRTVTVNSISSVVTSANSPVCSGNTLNLSAIVGGGTNLVTNGNFNTASVTGFSTDVPSSSFGFTTNPTNVYSGWPNFGDRTTGSGNMMWFSDDNTATNRRQWYQSYSVTSGQTYTMSVWTRNILSGNPTLYWSVNGTQVGSSVTPTVANGWVQLVHTWTATSTGTVTFAVVLSQNSWDYDFVLDDVEIRPTTLATYSWSGPNSFTSTAQNPAINNVTAAAAGTYTVTVTSGGCTTTSSTTAAVTNCTCSITLTPTVSSCYLVGGVSKATVSVKVDWAYAASGSITVTLGSQTRTITPGTTTQNYLGLPPGNVNVPGTQTIVSPQVVAFEVDANGASGTVSASFASMPSCSASASYTAPPACPSTSCPSNQIGGMVFFDYDADGVRDAGEISGLSGVTVQAYNSSAGLLGTTTTDAYGKYAFSGLNLASYPIRVEFSNISSIYGGTSNGTDGRTNVQFINAPDCNVDLGVLNGVEYCQSNPKIYAPLLVNGDPLPSGSVAGAKNGIVSLDYNASGVLGTYPMTVIATASQVGTLWGTAYNRFNNRLYSTAFIRRHAGLGPAGIGGLYITNLTNNTTTSFDLSTIGINVGSMSSNSSRGLSSDPTLPSADAVAFAAVAKQGLGDVDISEDGTFLYIVSLADAKLNKVNISGTNPTLSASYSIPNPGCVNGGWRPFATKVFRGKVYVGGVCDAQNSGSKGDLSATIYEFDPTNATFTSIFNFPLTYPKGYADIADPNITGWFPWVDVFSGLSASSSQPEMIIYPQPILSDIEFDIDGSIVIGFSDRTALQTGYKNFNTSGGVASNGNYFSSVSGGDILRAQKAGSSYILENNAKVGSVTGYGPNNNQGSGFGEFYNDNYNGETGNYFHTENGFGALAILPGSGEVLFTTVDPVNIPIGYTGDAWSEYSWSGGIRHLSNTNGQLNSAVQLYRSINYSANNQTTGSFGKSIGLGDIEVGCSTVNYLEIGNYVWHDADADGIQDASESPISGADVRLYNRTGTLVGKATTNAQGEYYFNSTNVDTTGVNATSGAALTSFSGMSPNTRYYVVVGRDGSFNTSTNRLTVGSNTYLLTTANTGQGTNPDINDSDATIASGVLAAFNGFPFISFIAGNSGTVNHTYDFGFVCNLAAPTVTPASRCGTGTVTLGAAGCTGGTINWYAVASGGTSLGTGTSFTTPSLSVTTTYYAECTLNGCVSPRTAVVATINPIPTVSITGTNIICNGSNTTLTASGGGTYLWSTSATTAAITVSPTVTTTYTVTVTNVGCTATASVTVTVNAVPTASISGTNTICTATSTTLTASGGGTYLWSTNATTAAITVSPTVTTTYNVTVTNASGCTATASRTVTVNSLPTASISGTNIICTGTNTTLTASGGGTYLWSTSATTAAITVSPTVTTTYNVTVTNASGCTAIASTTVTVSSLPTASVSGTNTICMNTSTTLTASGGSTYLWSTSATTAAITVSPVATTTYSVTVTNASGCTATASRTVTVNSLPTASISGTNIICTGSNTTLTASGGGTYLWSTSATTAAITVSPTVTTTYNVTLTNASGCTATASITVTVNSLPTATASGSTVCIGGTITLTSSGGTSYVWSGPNSFSNNTQNPTISAATIAMAGTYTVTVTNANNCTATATATVSVLNDPTINVTGGDVTVCVGTTNVTLTANASGGTGTFAYIWQSSPNNSTWTTISGATSSTYTITASTTSNLFYRVSVTQTGSGCNANPSVAVQVVVVADPIVSITATSTTVCYNTGTTINSTITGGAGTCTYTWESSPNGSTGWTIISGATSSFYSTGNLLTTTYYRVSYACTVTNCGSTTSNVLAITVNPNITINAGSDVTICSGSSTILNSTVIGGTSPYTYTWTPSTFLSGTNIANPTATPTVTTTYTLSITDTRGCTGATDQVIVNVNNPVSAGTATNPSPICRANAGLSNINLFNQLNGESTGGAWSIFSGNPGTNFTAATGILNPNGLATGIYVFRYSVTGVSPCPNDTEDVSVEIYFCCPPQICIQGPSFIKN